jgi:hypothetical protein
MQGKEKEEAVSESSAYSEMMQQMKAERDQLIQHFDKDKDLKEKIIIDGIK